MTKAKHTPSGVYTITNGLTGQHYVGSSVNIRKRWVRHLDDLRQNRHHSLKLQRAWNKYGEVSFQFVVVELVEDKGQLLSREQHWLDTTKSASTGYNILLLAGSNLGWVMPAEQREKIRITRTGSKASESARANMSRFQKARMADPAVRAAISALHLGAKRSPEAKANISAGKRGRPVSAEARLNMSAAQKSRAPASAATRAKISALHSGSTRSAETRAKMSEAQKARMRSPEERAKASAVHKGKTISAEQRAQISAKLRGRKIPAEQVEKALATKRRLKEQRTALGSAPEL